MTAKKSTTALYLFDYDGLARFLVETKKFNRTFKTTYNLLEEIGETKEDMFALYRVTTSMAHSAMFASAVCTPSGEFLKNRFTGMTGKNPKLPSDIRDLFNRHIIGV